MSKNTFIIILGLLIALTPYLGLSQNIKTFIFVFSGLLIAILVYFSSRERGSKVSKNEVFEENNNFPDTSASLGLTEEQGQDSFLK